MRKALVIGLDCAAPDLLFNRFLDKLPNFQKMMNKGIYGKLQSCDPPITIPAWMVMASSKSPGTLGLYGFRHRKENSYNEIWIASSNRVKEKRIWDYIAEIGGKSCVIGVPPSYPPFRIQGYLIGGFITPDTNRDYTYPTNLKEEISRLVGKYPVDVEFRINDKESLIQDIFEMTKIHFKVVKHLIKRRKWDFFMFVEIGLDRVHHAFWKYFDKTHHLYEPNNKFEKVIEEYYVYLDKNVGDLLKLIDNDTVVIVASDHGAKPMKGAFCINSWLMEKGLLKLREPVKGILRLSDLKVDWANTLAWGWGGYYARIFLNLKGRESQGIISPEDYYDTRKKIADSIRNIRGPKGENWDTKVMFPEEIYSECKGDPPDMMVYFDDLNWRSAGTIGHSDLYLPENDTGPDDAVHDKMGLYIYFDPRKDLGGRSEDLDITDISPTILKAMGFKTPAGMEGKPLQNI